MKIGDRALMLDKTIYRTALCLYKSVCQQLLSLRVTTGPKWGNCWLPTDSPRHSPVISFEHKLRSTTEALFLSKLINTATRVQGGFHNIRRLIFIDRPGQNLLKSPGLCQHFLTSITFRSTSGSTFNTSE